MNRFWHQYLVFCYMTLASCAILMAWIVISAPFHGYTITVRTNNIGEGVLEAILLLLSLPGWAFWLHHIIRTLLRLDPARAARNATAIGGERAPSIERV